MSDATRARHIFNKWASELPNKDLSWDHVLQNFDELFYNLYTASVDATTAEQLLKEAISKHLPTNATAKHTYKFVKDKNRSFKEFLDEWKQGIENFANQAFYAYYQLDAPEEKEEKKYGSMSTKEYIQQKRYAESFEEVDIIAFKKQLGEDK